MIFYNLGRETFEKENKARRTGKGDRFPNVPFWIITLRQLKKWQIVPFMGVEYVVSTSQ